MQPGRLLTRMEFAAVLRGTVDRLVKLGIEPALAMRAIALEHGIAPAHAWALREKLDSVFHTPCIDEVGLLSVAASYQGMR